MTVLSRVTQVLAQRRTRQAEPVLVLAIGLALTFTATLVSLVVLRANAELRFQNQVRQIQETLQSNLNLYTSMLRGVGGLFATRDDISGDDFRRYISRLDLEHNYPGVQGIGFGRYVTAGERAAFVAQVRASGVPAYDIWPGDTRAAYVPVRYYEPEQPSNRYVLGFDMLNEANRRAALERTRDTGLPVLSNRVVLIQSTDSSAPAGFLIYVPVYHGGTVPATVAERRQKLLGYVYSPFRASTTLHAILDSQQTGSIYFSIYDGANTDENRLLDRSDNTPDLERRATFRKITSISVADHTWTLVFAAPATIDDLSLVLVGVLVLLGTLFSIVLYLFARGQIQARQVAEDAVKARDLFLSVASHELRSPLTAMLGNAQMLQRRAMQDGRFSARDRRNVAVLVEQSVRLNRLIGVLLDHSRIQAAQLTLNRQPLDVCQLVSRLVNEVRASTPSHTFGFDAPNEPLVVDGDELRLEQVFHNLLNNAIKYSPDGSNIDVQLATTGEWAVIQICDTGIGIPADALPHLFQEFYRAPNVHQQIGGLGIGLFVIREIVNRHDGSISVESVERQGSTFTVRLPLLRGMDLVLETDPSRRNLQPRTTNEQT